MYNLCRDWVITLGIKEYRKFISSRSMRRKSTSRLSRINGSKSSRRCKTRSEAAFWRQPGDRTEFLGRILPSKLPQAATFCQMLKLAMICKRWGIR